jgi:hypothetical protein
MKQFIAIAGVLYTPEKVGAGRTAFGGLHRPQPHRISARVVVCMPVMLVMNVPVRMRQGFMFMLVSVALGQVQPDANSHQARRQPERQRRRLAEHQVAQRGADKWRGGKVSTGARSTQVTESPHEEDKTDAVTDQTNEHRRADE